MTMLDLILSCVRRACAAAPAVLVSLLMAPAAYSEEQSTGLGAGAATRAPVVGLGYYEEFKARSCSSVGTCTLTYATVPAGKLLVVNHVSCHVNAGGTAELFGLSLTASFQSTHLTPVLIGNTGTTRIFQSSNEVQKLVQAGIAPSVTVTFGTATNSNFNCLVAGQLKP